MSLGVFLVHISTHLKDDVKTYKDYYFDYYEIWASSYSTLRNWSVHLFIWVKMKLTQISNDKLLKPVDL